MGNIYVKTGLISILLCFLAGSFASDIAIFNEDVQPYTYVVADNVEVEFDIFATATYAGTNKRINPIKFRPCLDSELFYMVHVVRSNEVFRTVQDNRELLVKNVRFCMEERENLDVDKFVVNISGFRIKGPVREDSGK